MNEQNEKDLLLKDQNKVINVINNKVKTLLLESEETKNHRELKSILGWDEVDQQIESEKRKALELQHAINEFKSDDVIEESVLLNYCFSNNYVVMRLRDYKSKLLPDMLKSIENYVKEQGWTMSDTNLSQLYILCSFSEANSNPLKSRYSKTKNNKVIILHKIDERNYSSTIFKIVSEHGNSNKFKNFFRSLFFSHTRTLNLLTNSILFVGGPLLFLIIMNVTNYFTRIDQNCNDAEYLGYSFYKISLIMLGILVIKCIVPMTKHKKESTLNYHNDDKYSFTNHYDLAINYFSTSYLSYYFPFKNKPYGERNYRLSVNKNLKLRVAFGRFLILLTFLGILKGGVYLTRYLDVLKYGDRVHSIWVDKNNGEYKEVITSLNKNGFGYKTTTIYKKTTIK